MTNIIENKQKWQNKRLKTVKIIILGSLLFVGILGYGVYLAFFDMNRLPKGDYLTEVTSPNGFYTLKGYVNSGGATTSYTIRVELVFNKRSSKTTKNIYWNYCENNAHINWIDNDTVVINGHTINVPNDKFDFRNN